MAAACWIQYVGAAPGYGLATLLNGAKEQMDKNLRPLSQNVVVQPVEDEQRTASGIYIPDSAKKRPDKGTVVAVGPGRMLDNGQRATPEVAPGDLVYFNRYGATEVTLEGVDYLIMPEEQIQCVLQGALQEAAV